MNKNIECEECGKFFSKKGISTHKWRTHGAGRNHDPNQLRKTNDKIVKCEYCKKDINYRSIKKHTDSCFLNPTNHHYCLYCNTLLMKPGKFCNHSCAASYNNIHIDRKHGPDGTFAELDLTKVKSFSIIRED